MKTSDTLLISRLKANEMLHLSRNASYRLLRRTRVRGKVLMADVRAALASAARNGAQWSGGEIVLLNGDALGISQRSMYRALRKSPHFRISRKVALVESSRINEFLVEK